VTATPTIPHAVLPAGAVERLASILDELETGAPSRETCDALANAVRKAEFDGVTIEAALGLIGKWRGALRAAERRLAIEEAVPSNSNGNMRATAWDLYQRLRRYAAAGYRADRRKRIAPKGERGLLFRILQANGGKSPAFSTVREWLANYPVSQPATQREFESP